jgi:hypothetical protein
MSRPLSRLWSTARETTQRLCKKWFGGPRLRPRRHTRLWLEGLEDRIVPTIPTLTSTLNPSYFSQAVTFHAAVAPSGGFTPTGTIVFYDGSTALDTETLDSTGAAAFTTSTLAVNSHDMTAAYSGDSHFTSGTSAHLSQVVNQVNTNTWLIPSANALLPNQPLTLVAVVNPTIFTAGMPGGTVTFYNGATSLGSATLSGGQVGINVAAGFAAGTYTLTVQYGGTTNFHSSTSVNVSLVVGNPNSVAGSIGSAANCGCPNEEGTMIQAAANASGAANSSSPYPVRYADGVAQIANTDLASNGFGSRWAQTRSWTNGPGYAADGVNGVGWVDTWMPYLLQINGTTTLAAISNGMTAEYFDLSHGSYSPRYFDQNTLVHDTTVNQYVLTDELGDQLRFYDFTGSWTAGQQGQFASFTDPAGDVAAVISHNSAGEMTEVRRSSGSLVESWQYSYLTSGDPNAGKLNNVTLRRSTNSGSTWTTVRQVAYTYYDGTQSHGNLGDLMTAVVETAAGTAIHTDYYRYYTAAETAGGANGFVHGLEYAITGASYARLTAALGSSVDSLSNSQVAAYANHYFEYDLSLRVTKEIAQTAGGSSSGGLGTYTFSYTASSNSPDFNKWATKTVEGLPDGNENITYTNAYGEVMLAVHHDTTSGQKWDNFYEYDSAGGLILAAAPSAVSGYDDTCCTSAAAAMPISTTASA